MPKRGGRRDGTTGEGSHCCTAIEGTREASCVYANCISNSIDTYCGGMVHVCKVLNVIENILNVNED